MDSLAHLLVLGDLPGGLCMAHIVVSNAVKVGSCVDVVLEQVLRNVVSFH